jgi:hypothetical protein
MNYMSFQAFNDLHDAFKNSPYNQDLAKFRASLQNAEAIGQCRVLFTANDGNDYAIVEASNAYFCIGLTNSIDDTVGDLIAFSQHASYREAMNEMLEMSVNDYGY